MTRDFVKVALKATNQNIQKNQSVIILITSNYTVISDLTPLRDSSVQQREFSTNIMSLVDISKVNTTITKPLSFSDKKFHSIAIVVSGQLAGGARGLTRYV